MTLNMPCLKLVQFLDFPYEAESQLSFPLSVSVSDNMIMNVERTYPPKLLAGHGQSPGKMDSYEVASSLKFNLRSGFPIFFFAAGRNA